jgi:hypothetical protein
MRRSARILTAVAAGVAATALAAPAALGASGAPKAFEEPAARPAVAGGATGVDWSDAGAGAALGLGMGAAAAALLAARGSGRPAHP